MKITDIYKDGNRVQKDDKLCNHLIDGIKKDLDDLMFKGNAKKMDRKNACSINVSNVRLSEEYIRKYGYNVSGWSGRRGRYLSWDNWVDLNGEVNELFDENGVRADIKSLGGKFIIRNVETGKKDESDWEKIKQENVGSMMRPLPRHKAWQPESPH